MKIGIEYKKIILKDHREYESAEGAMRTRGADWQKAHDILLEHESLEGDASPLPIAAASPAEYAAGGNQKSSVCAICAAAVSAGSLQGFNGLVS